MTSGVLKEAEKLGFTLTTQMHSSDKAIVYKGMSADSRFVIYKKLNSSEEGWAAKFAKEVHVYKLFEQQLVKFPHPKLYQCGHDVLVVEFIEGLHLTTQRYPIGPLPEQYLQQAIDSLNKISQWSAPSNKIFKPYDYKSRAQKYYDAGYFSQEAMLLLQLCLDQYPESEFQINHGDALLSNVIFSNKPKEAIFFDWEFVDLYLPFFDLALLHTILSFDKSTARTIETYVEKHAKALPFWVNKTILLAREIKMHEALPDHLEFKRPILDRLYRDQDDMTKRLPNLINSARHGKILENH